MQGTNPPSGTSQRATAGGQSKSSDPSEKLLRIGVIHGKSIVEERFIRGAGDVTVGSDASNVLQLVGMGAPATMKLFESKGQGRYALLIEKGVDGRIDLGGQPETFRELAEAGKAKKRGNVYVVDLPEGARGRVVIGQVVILFQFVDAPPSDRQALTAVLKGGLLYKMDWPYRYILGAVFMVMGGTGLALNLWWTITGQYYHNPFGSEEEAYAALRVEVKPEKKKKETQAVKVEAPPIKVEAPQAADAKKPEAAKSSGPKGRDKAGPVSRESRRAKMAEGVRSKTFLSALGPSGGGPVVHDSNYAAAFDAAESAATGPVADAGGPTQAGGGGEGGRYKTLNQSDVGGSRLETTTAKTADKTADSEVKIKANVRDGAISGQEGTGKIDKDSVARVFSRRKGAIKYCYENALRVDQNLKGKVTIRFTIGPAGRITNISAVSNSTGNGAVADCIIEKVQGWRFDPPDNGSVTFSYPFLLDTK